MNGNCISTEFDERPQVRGEFLIIDDHLYRHDGSLVVEEEISELYDDEFTNQAWIVEYDKDDATVYQIIKKDGTVLAEIADSAVTVDRDYGTFRVDGDKVMAYCYWDKDFTIDCSFCLNMWLVVTENADGTYNVVDTISGQTLISGYQSYSLYERAGYAMYVEADNGDGTYDFYIVK